MLVGQGVVQKGEVRVCLKALDPDEDAAKYRF